MKTAILKPAIIKSATLTALVSSLTLLGISAAAYADDAPAASAAPAAPASPALPSFPSMGGSLTTNAKPFSFDAGPVGNVFVTGVVSGIAQAQSNPVGNVANSQADISNAQVFINKTDGLIQFSGQFGSYSIPDLGAPYVKAEKVPQATYGIFSQGFIKIAPSDSFNVMVGKLPTLIGDEYTFSFENMNIERGLLWNQEPAVSRGVQANYTQGPLALSLSFNDGYYSNKYNTVSAAATYTMDTSNTFAFSGSGHTGGFTSVSSSATPVLQNNGEIYNLIYTHTSGPWTFQPYLQYNYVPDLNALGTKSVSATGAALLTSYKVNDNYSLPVRLEYITSTGSANNAADPSLLYGAGSKAYSVTITPTYQYKIFFVRGELSVVGISSGTKGSEFGKNGDKTTQVSGLLETGLMF
jgi:hypothetical protein